MTNQAAQIPNKILLVDDNIAFVDTIKDILEDKGFEVDTADCGETALECVRDQAFDLVLMDIKMPGMNGVECFLSMKEINADARVILFTAYALDELIQQAHNNGVLAVLKKPLEIELLINTISQCRS